MARKKKPQAEQSPELLARSAAESDLAQFLPQTAKPANLRLIEQAREAVLGLMESRPQYDAVPPDTLTEELIRRGHGEAASRWAIHSLLKDRWLLLSTDNEAAATLILDPFALLRAGRDAVIGVNDSASVARLGDHIKQLDAAPGEWTSLETIGGMLRILGDVERTGGNLDNSRMIDARISEWLQRRGWIRNGRLAGFTASLQELIADYCRKHRVAVQAVLRMTPAAFADALDADSSRKSPPPNSAQIESVRTVLKESGRTDLTRETITKQQRGCVFFKWLREGICDLSSGSTNGVRRLSSRRRLGLGG